MNQLRQYALGASGIGGNAGATATGPQNPINLFRGLNQGSGSQAPFQMPGLPPEIQQAMGQYGNYAQLGQQGLSALGGGPNPFMNAYSQQMNPFFAQQRQQAVEGANQQSTLAGAFGGDRSQIASAVAGSQADQNQAAFNYQGFNDSQQRALQAAYMGFGATGAQAFLPQQFHQGQLGILNAGMGPYGQTQTQQTQSDPFSQLLGIAGIAGGLGWAPFAAGAASG